MKRKFTIGLLLTILALVFGAAYVRSQEAPEPPEPPEAPGPSLDNYQSLVVSLERSAELGVTLKDVTAEKAKELKLPGEYGALVERVEAGSAAAKAGLEKGDVIVEFAGERVRSEAQLRRLIRETPAGRTVNLQVIRAGQTRTLSAKLQERSNHLYVQPPEIQIPEMNINPRMQEPYLRYFGSLFEGGRPSLGISGDELTTQLAGYFGVKQGKGVLVREVVMGSPAANAGLKAGDVIVAVDGKSVATVTELRQALAIKPGEDKRKLSLTVVRNHQEQTVPVELARPGAGDREKEAWLPGIDQREFERLETQLKAQLAAAQKALQESQWQLGDQQRLLSEKLRQATEAYRKAVQEQLKLQLRQQLKVRQQEEIKLQLQNQTQRKLQEQLKRQLEQQLERVRAQNWII
jgi:PDZ domain-containing secreted protein